MCTENEQVFDGTRVLLLASLRPACGNYTTICRIKTHLESHHIACYMRDTDEFQNAGEFLDYLRHTGITQMLILHAVRGGRWLYEIGDDHLKTIPYTVIYGGTDLNEGCKDSHNLKVMTKVISRARGLVAFNNEMKQRALDIWDSCIAENNNLESLKTKEFRVIPQAVVTAPSGRNVCDEIRKQYNLDSEAVFFTLTSGIRPVKDPLYLVQAFSEWHSKRESKCYLLIVGPKLNLPYAEEFERVIAHHNAILYIGTRDSADTHALIRDSIALVNCSRSEGMSAAILEAMSLGVPVIARNIPGNAAIISDGENGLLFSSPQEFVKKAEDILHNEDLRKTIFINGKQYVEQNHSSRAECHAYMSLVRTLNTLR